MTCVSLNVLCIGWKPLSLNGQSSFQKKMIKLEEKHYVFIKIILNSWNGIENVIKLWTQLAQQPLHWPNVLQMCSKAYLWHPERRLCWWGGLFHIPLILHSDMLMNLTNHIVMGGKNHGEGRQEGEVIRWSLFHCILTPLLTLSALFLCKGKNIFKDTSFTQRIPPVTF